MTDPEEKKENTQKEQDNDTSTDSARKANESSYSNWNEHMQIDEEGNEVSPDDE